MSIDSDITDSTEHADVTDVTDPGALAEPAEAPEEDIVEVRRDGPLSAVIAGGAGLVAVAYLLRAVGSGSVLDWVVFVAVGALAVLHGATMLDSRAPLMVVDRLGVRVRRGRTWEGVGWSDVDRVEHAARESMLRDGSLTVVDADGRRLGVRLSLSTQLFGANWHELSGALDELSGGTVAVVAPTTSKDGQPVDEPDEDEPVEETPADEAPVEETPADEAPVDETPLDEERHEATVDEAPHEAPGDPSVATSEETTVNPLRALVRGRRSEVVVAPREHHEPDVASTTQTAITAFLGQEVRPETVAGSTPEPETPARVPVIGPELAAARTRLGLGVDQLADRTRIRSHVIESIEVDDFAPCGGDFYARGHLRTLSRVLGIDATDLLATYDETYADEPIDPRSVFSAELARSSGGSLRGARSGLNWSVLVAAVMAVVLVWSIARLVMDAPVPLADRPVLNGSPGGKATLSGATTKVPVEITAATGGATVIVRDGNQKVVFKDQLAFMQTTELQAVAPINVSSTDGGVQVVVDGVDEGALGETGQDAKDVFVP